MLKTMKDKFTRIKTNLTGVDSQPLGKAALIIILFLDVFILISIFDGLEKHTRQISAPDEYIPSSCREIVIHRDWNGTNRLDNLASIILSHSNSYYPIEEKKKERHPVCASNVRLRTCI